ncbi:choice-of-anchor J domain-containing protein [Winogradskyella ursingii]|uniref:choice-of-anchor J domain-containing protein n=1 Tax=Winogradskyella ursingii TaxID=2686079 RepID=UPI0015CDD46B|nr:choice-of-anchor J domain-containing protein [Winogradskyella ursingii]
MKKIIYLTAFIGLTFLGCDPIEDINNDIEEEVIVGVDEFTLTSDDYTDLVDQPDDAEPDYYETFEAFRDLDDAKATLPAFLSDRYPFWGNGSSVTVNFNLYDGNPEDVSAFANAEVYTLGAEDYPTANSNAFLMGEDIETTLDDVLAEQFVMPSEGQVVRLSYNQFTEAPEVGLASVYEAAFPANFNDFELIEILDDGLEGGDDNLGWRNQSAFAEGSGFAGGANATEELLISPEIDLTNNGGLFLQITQEIDFLGDPDLISVEISTDYTTGSDPMTATWTVFDYDKTIYPDMTTSEDFDFSQFDGETIHVALRYSSTDTDSSRWRVESFAIRTTGFEGETENVSVYYRYSEGSWNETEGVYYLTNDDYDSMGEESGQPGRFNNFSDSVAPGDYLPQFLSIEYPFAQEEDEIFVIYRFFRGGSVGTVTRGNLYTFVNGSWVEQTSSLQFGLENGIWVPDNTIRYTLAGSDYDLVATTLLNEEGFEAAAGNLNNFGNFNRTGSGTSWNDEMMLRAMNIVLDNLNPNAEEGQKYVVTANTFGASSTEDFSVIKVEGEWEYQTED